MDNDTMSSVKCQLKNDFIGYKIKRVANHITTMKVTDAYYFFKKNSYREIKFSHNFTWVRTRFTFYVKVYKNKYEINCAIDEVNKVVYWNYKCIQREFIA